MEWSNTLAGHREKRAELSGRIETLQQDLIIDLDHLEHRIRPFDLDHESGPKPPSSSRPVKRVGACLFKLQHKGLVREVASEETYQRRGMARQAPRCRREGWCHSPGGYASPQSGGPAAKGAGAPALPRGPSRLPLAPTHRRTLLVARRWERSSPGASSQMSSTMRGYADRPSRNRHDLGAGPFQYRVERVGCRDFTPATRQYASDHQFPAVSDAADAPDRAPARQAPGSLFNAS